MRRKNKKRLDQTLTGFLAGFFLPVLIFLGVWITGENDLSFRQYLENLWYLNALIKLGSLCVFANLLLFMGFIRLKYDRAAKGVLGATIIYALFVLLSKAF